MKKVAFWGVLLLMVLVFPLQAFASEQIVQNHVSKGYNGNNVSFSFMFKNTSGLPTGENTVAGISCSGVSYEDYSFPFEVTDSQVIEKKIGNIESGHSVTVNFNMKIRHDIPEGYYKIPVYVYTDTTGYTEDLTIFVAKAASSKDPVAQDTHIAFELGEGQNTPYAEYPQILNFELNLRNSGTRTANDVTAHMVCNSDPTKFPLDINEANYDRHYDIIPSGETVSLAYSFAIRPDTYTGYYEVPFKITYRDGSESDLQTIEKSIYIHIKNKARPEDAREFNANDRVKARIVVDGFRTEPAEIFAGNPFDLILRMKNASKDVAASNILFTFESEKVSDSPVFTTNSGSNSLVVNSLNAGETVELKMHFSARAGIDQRSYAINIIEKYDSPEFKNAEEKVLVDIPVKQIAKFNMGNVEILPTSIQVGDEANVMFPINNTGRVLLYNVMVRFESDSIQTNETYIGNLKPGESGNVDVMIRGTAATQDDGDISVVISYEDEYGTVTETTKTINLYVAEAQDVSMDFDIPVLSEEEKPPVWKQPWFWGVITLVLAGVVVAIVLIRKKKKESALQITDDDLKEEDTESDENQ